MRSLVAAILIIVIGFSFAQLGCTPGQLACENETAYKVCNGRALWDSPVGCIDGETCVDGKCQIAGPIGCNPGTRECTSTTSYRVCNGYAIWDPEQSCNVGTTCSNGYCNPLPTCNYNDVRCTPDGNGVQVCDVSGQWQYWKACSWGCTSGYCKECSPGTRQCTDSATYKECMPNYRWGPEQSCGTGSSCSGGSCSQTPYGSCQSYGATRCSPTNINQLQRCGDNYRWQDWQYCQVGCFSNSCRQCASGETKCSDSGNGYLKCINGQWADVIACPTGYFCSNGACQVTSANACSVVGQTRCSPSNSKMIQKCSQNNVYLDSQQCDNGCVNGNCAACKIGTTTCDGVNTYRICTDAGVLSDERTCQSGYNCQNGSCVVAPQCTDGQRRCTDNNVYSCAGGKWGMLIDCPDNTGCTSSQGTAYCEKQAQPEPVPLIQPNNTGGNGNKQSGDNGGMLMLIIGGVVAVVVVGGIIAGGMFMMNRKSE